LSTNSIVRGFFWVLVATLLAFIAKSNGQNPIFYFCGAGLIIIASVMEAAHANDRFGHDVGDQVLCMVTSHLRRVGGGGKPYRYGGEELTIVFSGKSKEEAIPHLERLRQSIGAAQFGLCNKNRPKNPPQKINRGKTQPKNRVRDNEHRRC
jgi:GGDEF domain-containing protein